MIGLIFNLPNFLVIVGGGFTWFWCNKKYKNTKSHALLNCIPGVFTSLGLLGTFWSICYSLHGLGGVQPELIDNTGKTLAEVQAAGSRNIDIMNIISELIPAFTSSILDCLVHLLRQYGQRTYLQKKKNWKVKSSITFLQKSIYVILLSTQRK